MGGVQPWVGVLMKNAFIFYQISDVHALVVAKERRKLVSEDVVDVVGRMKDPSDVVGFECKGSGSAHLHREGECVAFAMTNYTSGEEAKLLIPASLLPSAIQCVETAKDWEDLILALGKMAKASL